jgi:hypothetical protein
MHQGDEWAVIDTGPFRIPCTAVMTVADFTTAQLVDELHRRAVAVPAEPAE